MGLNCQVSQVPIEASIHGTLHPRMVHSYYGRPRKDVTADTIFRIHFRLYDRTKMYLKTRRPSTAGNGALHRMQDTLPRIGAAEGSIVTILYSAPQLGQLNRMGSESLMNAEPHSRS